MKRSLKFLLVFVFVFFNTQLSVYASSEIKVKEDVSFSTLKHVKDEIIVKYKNDSKPFRVIKVKEGKVLEKVKEYQNKKEVVYAEPNYILSSYTVNDPFYGYQWNFKDITYGGANVENAWASATGSGVIVAIIDTGVAYTKVGRYPAAEDLVGTQFIEGYDFVNNDTVAYDDNGHGTHVAGTVASATNNSLGVAGIAYNSTIMPIKVLDRSSSGSTDNVAEGIRFAVDNGAQVINLSLGASIGSQTLKDAIDYAYLNNVVVVAATGNDGAEVGYPAAYDHVIAVGATDVLTNVTGYSNFGPEIDVVAPGGDLSIDADEDGNPDGILQRSEERRVGEEG